jgi:hypothetical protein
MDGITPSQFPDERLWDIVGDDAAVRVIGG